MSDVTVNKKLELMKQIRSRYRQDRSDLQHREQILYGKTSAAVPQEHGNWMEENAEQESDWTSLPLRCVLAGILFLALVICDKTDHSVLGMSADMCFRSISTDYESSIAAWAHTAFVKNPGENSLEDPPAGIRP